MIQYRHQVILSGPARLGYPLSEDIREVDRDGTRALSELRCGKTSGAKFPFVVPSMLSARTGRRSVESSAR